MRGGLDLLNFSPVPVILDIKNVINSNFKDMYSTYPKCPAFVNEFKNTFVIKSPTDFSINIDPSTSNPILSPTSFPEISVRQPQSKLFDLHIGTYFFSGEEVEISQIPASIHYNNFTENTMLLSGKYNIHKWFRPINPSGKFLIPKINVKRGDALYYVKFHTNKKIKFINFNFTPEIMKVAENCISVKTLQSNFSLTSLYNMFTQIGYQKKLLKEIKKNITDLK